MPSVHFSSGPWMHTFQPDFKLINYLAVAYLELADNIAKQDIVFGVEKLPQIKDSFGVVGVP